MSKIENDDEKYLRERGWRKRTGKHIGGPWEWYRPPLSGAYYTVGDAVTVQRGIDRIVESVAGRRADKKEKRDE